MSENYKQVEENIKNNIDDIYINNLKFKLHKTKIPVIIIDDYYENIEYYNKKQDNIKINKNLDKNIIQRSCEQIQRSCEQIQLSCEQVSPSEQVQHIKRNKNHKNIERLGMVALSTAVVVGSVLINNNIT